MLLLNEYKKNKRKKGGASLIPTIKVIKGSGKLYQVNSTEYCNIMKLYYNKFIYKKDFNPIDNIFMLLKPKKKETLEIMKIFYKIYN